MVTFIDGAVNIVVSCIYYSWDNYLAVAAVFWMVHSFFCNFTGVVLQQKLFVLFLYCFKKNRRCRVRENSSGEGGIEWKK